MSGSRMLAGKRIAVFAATGQVGAATAGVLAAHGAHLALSGRDNERLQLLADRINREGGEASVSLVDATDPVAVAAHLAGVAADGGLHGAFNAVGRTPAQLGYPARSTELDVGTFLEPYRLIAASTFITTVAAAPLIADSGGGSVVTLSSTLTGGAFANMAALTATCGAIEAMTRSLSGEFAPMGVRVNCVRGDAMPETTTIQETGARQAALTGMDPDTVLSPGPLGRPITARETAEAVAFLLSDTSGGITSQIVTVSGNPMAGG